MRRLMSDDIMREAGEDRIAAMSGEISEEHAAVFARIERVRFGEGMRGDMELVAVAAPRHAAAEGEFEAGQRPHDDRVDVLRVEARIVEQPPVGDGRPLPL